ncbi:hypothetical protein ES332_A04G090600v1 [Gossypium tomentosum]|uniref:AB hydrolase-1 domain-containing protein n=1 Tax=Gossypium tomentosum TaxID=34277 RepID=A0A5D2QZQ0_GOSTO|nr:hypothetical protein ES332_A04G090600v1 [Gossypium tomentosum]
MAAGVNRKISAASARAHTRRAKQNASFKLPSGICTKILLVLFAGILAWAYQAIQPPIPKTCGSPDGPLVTASRIKLKDGRYLAYKSTVFPEMQQSIKLSMSMALILVDMMLLFPIPCHRPGYGESDPNPKRTVQSLPLDIEELADQLRLGSKFYVIGFSMGGQVIWSCLKYIPHRLAGAALLAPVVNYWWPGFPTNLVTEAYQQQLPQDHWAVRVSHYAPWLTYWWNTQKWFPSSSVVAHSTDILNSEDKKLLPKIVSTRNYTAVVRQQGEYESLHRDLMIGFGTWEFSPMDLDNPFPNNEGSVYMWHGDEDKIVPVILQRYIAQQLPWIHYYELPGAGHMFPHAPGMSDNIVKVLVGE